MKIVHLLIAFLLSINTFAQLDKDDLIVFVGEKISIKKIKEKREKGKVVIDTIITENDTIIKKYTTIPNISFNQKFKAKYKILKMVNGDYKQDEIEFIVFDHYGKPKFSKYKNVLLFLKEYDGSYYHEKYLFFDVYRTKGNRWAGPYNSSAYNHSFKDDFTVKPEEIDFKRKVSFKIKNMDDEKIKRLYPEKFYEITEKRAFPNYGNYVEELFLLQFQGVLKARGYK